MFNRMRMIRGPDVGPAATFDAGWMHPLLGLSNGNRTASCSVADSTRKNARSSVLRPTTSGGLWYFEFTINEADIGGPNFGLLPSTASNTGTLFTEGFAWIGAAAYAQSSSSFATFGTTASTSTRQMYACDLGARQLRIGQNGTWFNGGASVWTIPVGTWAFAFTQFNGNLTATIHDSSEWLYFDATSNGFTASAAGYAAW